MTTELVKSPYAYYPDMPPSDGNKRVIDPYTGKETVWGDLVMDTGINALAERADLLIKAGALGLQAAMKILPKGFAAKYAADVYNRLAARDPLEARRILNTFNEFICASDEEIREELEKSYTCERPLPRAFSPELVMSIQSFVRQVRDKAIPMIPSLNDVIDAEK